MRAPKHTNSRWRAVPEDELTENGALLVETDGGTTVAHCWSAADQALIASAPDMLDALRLAQEYLSACALGDDILHLINDVLAKAAP